MTARGRGWSEGEFSIDLSRLAKLFIFYKSYSRHDKRVYATGATTPSSARTRRWCGGRPRDGRRGWRKIY